MANLRFIHSQMGAGKTAALLSTAFHLRQAGQRVLILTTADREDGVVTSRLGLTAEAVTIDPARSIREQVAEQGPQDHILVDEVQFLSPNQIEELAEITDEDAIDITCYGLRADFTGQAFPGSAHLFATADQVDTLQVEARCWCGKPATHNGRTHNGSLTRHGALVVLDRGGDISYEPLCRKHWKSGRIRQDQEQRG